MKEIKVIETSLRDGQQCLWATRMKTAWMLPIAERILRFMYSPADHVEKMLSAPRSRQITLPTANPCPH